MAAYDPYTLAKFWSKVDVNIDKRECWPWRAGTNEKGYGRFKHGGYTLRAHRVAWEIFNGRSLGDAVARHSCDNPICCNPYHITPGTAQDNVDDKVCRGRHKAPAEGTMQGENNPRAKLTEADVEVIRDRIQQGESDSAIAEGYRVTPSAIYMIRMGRSWSCGSTNQKESPK